GPPYVIPVSKKTLEMDFDEDHPVRKEGDPAAVANRLYYERRLEEWEQLKQLRYFAPLRKGDVLVWHSLTIHGSMDRHIQGGHRYSIQALYRDIQRQVGTYLGPCTTTIERVDDNFYMRRR
ncbi:MAG: phytanoyl-CoA dioxygenase family protein, partial [Alphaproteobacteria bacterium]|nr:phytanoyl-CoA dioxygenase family protein [Alphaproteobacteria bacterium]